jgi:hypothetical protein
MTCTKCGADVSANAQFCPSCGAAVAPPGPQAGAPAATATPEAGGRFAHLPQYWQSVFARFDQRPEHMQTYWNWPAFFFGAFWYLVKGLPVKGLLYLLVAVATTGIGWLFLMVYAGLYGPWDYYLKEAKGKQLW